nr:MAG TPA: hypothetical protein [Caudoviricetes sp.]
MSDQTESRFIAFALVMLLAILVFCLWVLTDIIL